MCCVILLKAVYSDASYDNCLFSGHAHRVVVLCANVPLGSLKQHHKSDAECGDVDAAFGGRGSGSHGDSGDTIDGESGDLGPSDEGGDAEPAPAPVVAATVQPPAKRPRLASAVAAAGPAEHMPDAEEGQGWLGGPNEGTGAALAASQPPPKWPARMSADGMRHTSHALHPQSDVTTKGAPPAAAADVDQRSRRVGEGTQTDLTKETRRAATDTQSAAARVQTKPVWGAHAPSAPPQPPLALPPPGGVYVFEGQSVSVPNAWPTEPRTGTEVLCPELRAVILSVLHPKTTVLAQTGKLRRYGAFHACMLSCCISRWPPTNTLFRVVGLLPLRPQGTASAGCQVI